MDPIPFSGSIQLIGSHRVLFILDGRRFSLSTDQLAERLGEHFDRLIRQLSEKVTDAQRTSG